MTVKVIENNKSRQANINILVEEKEMKLNLLNVKLKPIRYNVSHFIKPIETIKKNIKFYPKL